jgi:hypothetical protein
MSGPGRVGRLRGPLRTDPAVDVGQQAGRGQHLSDTVCRPIGSVAILGLDLTSRKSFTRPRVLDIEGSSLSHPQRWQNLHRGCPPLMAVFEGMPSPWRDPLAGGSCPH